MKKNILIIILLLCVIILLTLNFFKIDYTVARKNFLIEYTCIQSELSKYIGKMSEETFDTYTNLQLLYGSTEFDDADNTRICNLENVELANIISNEYIEKDEKKYYKINKGTLQKVLNISILINEVNWYIGENGIILVSYNQIPEWWAKEYSAFLV